jgi:hypothetical protein
MVSPQIENSQATTRTWGGYLQEKAELVQSHVPVTKPVFNILAYSLSTASSLLTRPASASINEDPVIISQREQVLEKLEEVAENIGYKQNSTEYSMAVASLQNPNIDLDENSLSNLHQVLSNVIGGKNQKTQLSNTISKFLETNKITFKNHVLEKFKSVYSEVTGNRVSSGHRNVTSLLLNSNNDINKNSLLELNNALSKLNTDDNNITRKSSGLAIAIQKFLTQNLHLMVNK